jgi:hypothetical protein
MRINDHNLFSHTEHVLVIRGCWDYIIINPSNVCSKINRLFHEGRVYAPAGKKSISARAPAADENAKSAFHDVCIAPDSPRPPHNGIKLRIKAN